MKILHGSVLAMLLLASADRASAEDGYDLWLRYAAPTAAEAEPRQHAITAFRTLGDSDTIEAVRAELARALPALTGHAVGEHTGGAAAGTLLVGALPALRAQGIELADEAAIGTRLGDEGYVLRSIPAGDGRAIIVTARTDAGLLYGTFALLRLLQTNQPLEALDVLSSPAIDHRVLQHWDNLDGSTERVFSEDPRSIWWDGDHGAPVSEDRWRDYARACASIGINTVVLNNVNAETAVLLPAKLREVKRIADVLRPYAIRVALSANYAAPRPPDYKFRRGPGIGDLDTGDPTDPRVEAWWAAKAAEIYALVPDFAGFLVKAGAEGMPGPEKYKQPASVAANMFGRVLRPHGGIVMWRTFTWDETDPDPSKRQFIRYAPQDAGFDRGNVFLQNKYGPRDFMAREPFHPLFGAMSHTQLSLEVQITQEYTGHDKYLMYWGPLWQEILRSDTHAKGPGSTIAEVIDGRLHGYDATQIAGVANVSRVRNWTGHHFAQANWYAFGRFAWDPNIDARDVAEEWVRMTWGNEPAVVEKLLDVTMASHQAVTDYVGPLGIAHTNSLDGEHYETKPSEEDFWQRQFINATPEGIGKDRTATGTGATTQYQPAVAEMFENPETCPPALLLWFHHVGWDEPLASTGKTTWQTLQERYARGVSEVERFIEVWQSLRPHIDADRHAHVLERLHVQEAHARKYRDLWLRHFEQIRARRP